VVFAIEGGHVFSKRPDGEVDTIQNILKKIDYIKNNWEYPVLFLSLTHLYSNGLCGHARGLPDNVCWFSNQQIDMNEGLTDIGLVMIRKLLSIDGSKGRRILVDVKHMSPKARKDYYYKVVIPYNNKNPQSKIPIIFSHGAYSGVETLDELIQFSRNEVTRKSATRNGFLATGLNFCSEEIEIIANSGGIIGLIMNERILASAKVLKGVKSKKDQKSWAYLLFDHIERIVRTIQAKEGSSKEKQKAWDCICAWDRL
jgi:microsomal dipeptidase-like Zn-dependent dipeptidase